MELSEKHDVILAKLTALHHALAPVPKGASNDHFGSRYADLPSILLAVRPPMDKLGLSLHFTFEEPFEEERPYVPVVVTVLHGESGQWARTTLYMYLDKATPQAVGSAITYGQRYATAAILGLVTCDDDDAETASGRGRSNGKASNGKTTSTDDLL
jgi:hypothetical protein